MMDDMKKTTLVCQQTQQRLIDFLQQALPSCADEWFETLAEKHRNDHELQRQVIDLQNVQNMLSNQYQRCLDQIEQQKQDVQQHIHVQQQLQALAHGIYLDTQQPLMWRLFALGESVQQFVLSGSPVAYGFLAAQMACERLDFAGFQDWRLPSIHQLKRLNRQSVPALLLTQRWPDVALWSTSANRQGTGAWAWQQGKAVLHPRKSDKFYVLAMRRVKASDQPLLSH
jgi:hypothetical protein